MEESKRKNTVRLDKGIINILHDIDWFDSCGDKTAADITTPYMFIDDPADITDEISSEGWEKYTGNALNELTEHLSADHREAYDCWNDLVEEVREKVFPKLFPIIEDDFSRRIKGCDREGILEDMKLNILGIIMAYSYSSFYPPGLHKELLKIYRSGHIPCGVKHGKSPYLIIF